MKGGFANNVVEEADEICFYDEEEKLLCGDTEKCGTKHSIRRICPDAIAN